MKRDEQQEEESTHVSDGLHASDGLEPKRGHFVCERRQAPGVRGGVEAHL